MNLNFLDNSKDCLIDAVYPPPDACFPPNADSNQRALASFAQALSFFNIIIGTLGNLFTLIAIPYAKSKNM